MKPLSAFDAKAWKQLYSGWEEFEHVDRMAEVAVRSEMLISLAGRYGDGSETYLAEVTKLLSWWRSLGAQGRARSWQVWW